MSRHFDRVVMNITVIKRVVMNIVVMNRVIMNRVMINKVMMNRVMTMNKMMAVEKGKSYCHVFIGFFLIVCENKWDSQ